MSERLRDYSDAAQLPAHTLSWKLIPDSKQDRGKIYGTDKRLHPVTCTGLIMTGGRFANEAIQDLNQTDFGNVSLPAVDLLPWAPQPTMTRGLTSVMLYRDTTRAEEVVEVTMTMREPATDGTATLWTLQGITLATQE